jgi:nicotinate-nucleotide adenylyltransferase
MRIGIYGGTFDPIHLGHLILAEQAREQARLDEVWFVPALRPPQKDSKTITRFDQRVEMLALALAGQPAFRIEELEKERDGPSYTVDTLIELRHRHPEHQFFLLLGGDALVDLHTWRNPQRIVEEAGLLVIARPGSRMVSASELRQRLGLAHETPLPLELVESPAIDLSSQDLRQRVAQGRTIRYFVPRAVEVYIHDKHLYQAG